MDQLNAEMLEAAARKLFAGSSVVKYYVLHQIIKAPGREVTLEQAAHAARVPLNILEPILRADKIFRLLNGAGPSGDSSCILRADEQMLLSKAGQGTSSIRSVAHRLKLVSIPPEGYVEGLHPVRPGLPTCLHWLRRRTCMHNQSCVFNHSELPPEPIGKDARKAATAQKRKQVKQAKAELKQYLSLATIVPPPPLPPARSRAECTGSAAASAATADAGSSSSSSSGVVRDPGTASISSSREVSSGSSSMQPPASTAVAAKVPQQPGLKEWVGRSMRPCAIPILPPQNPRLLDPDDWMPDKKSSSRPQEQDWAATAEASEARATAAAAWTEAFAAAASTAASAWSGTGSRESGRSGSELMPADAQPAPTAGAAPSAAAAASTAAETSTTRPSHMQPQHTPDATSSTAAGAAVRQQQQRAPHVWPQLGVNDAGLPMYSGAPNCYHYMGTGRCPAQGSTCRYHHPNGVLLPAAFIDKGYIPCINFATQPAPFACLVAHLQRLWDYSSCVEAQLKIWLAHYLLAAANPGCRLYSGSAAQLVAKESHSLDCDSQPLGPYSCSVSEADAVLQTLWAAAPDDSSSSPMPYARRLQELLEGDPYLQVQTPQDLGADDVPAVVLRVHAVTELLYF